MAAVLALQAAGPPPPGPAPGEGVPVRAAAIVTDRRGQLLAGLMPKDFTLLVDGEVQPLDGVELRRADATEPRTFAFLLDEFHTAPEHSAAIRDALLRFLDAQMREGDRVLVVRPLDPLTGLEPTGDREAIRRAVAGFEGRKGDFTPRTEFERTYMAQAPDAVAAARAQIVTSALRAIAMPGPSEGRRAVVLVSDGFARIRGSRELPASLQTAVRIANRADAPVYVIAPGIRAPHHPDAPDPEYAALSALTAQTGGTTATGTRDLDGALARMARDLDAHYVLSFRAPHGRDGRFHAMQIRVNRPGAEVRARGGYVAPAPPASPAAAGSSTGAPLRVIRRSPLIRAWSSAVPTSSGRAVVLLTWEPAAPRPGTAAKGTASAVVLTASTADGTRLFDGTVAAVGAAAGSTHDFASFEAPAGAIRVDMKVLDAKGVVIDTDARDIQVPAPRKEGPTIYTPAVLRTRSAREFREASANPIAAPAPAREFRRTERLLLRVPALDASGAAVPVSAVLLNRLRQPMRDLDAMTEQPLPGVTQFDLPLAPLAPGDYSVRLTVSGPSGAVSEYVTFKVTG
jgi:VWFA-related protein